MPGCSDDCFCNIEGTDGLETEGTGTPGDPYVVTPSGGRTIPATATSAAGLLGSTAAHKGLTSWVQDTQLLHVDTGAGHVPVSPEWAQYFPANLEFTDVGNGIRAFTSGGLTLGPGRWAICANGVLWGDIAAPDPCPGTPCTSITTVEVTIELYNAEGGLVVDTAEIQIDNLYIDDGAGLVLDFDKPFRQPFQLQIVDDVPVAETKQYRFAVQRDFVPSGGGGDWWLTAGDIWAIRVANHNNTQ